MTSYVNPSTHIGGVDQIVVPDRAAPSGVDEAPYDDEQYVRVNGEWVPVDTPEIVPDTMAPKPPTALTSSGTMIIGGGAVDYTLSWTPPTQNADGSPLTDFAYYVVRWRYGSSGAYFSFVSNDPATVLHGLKPATNIEWGVLARDYSGNDSPWASATITGITDTVGPERPSTPSVSSQLAVITVVWDGKDYTGAAPPPDFAYLEFYMSSTSGGPWSPVGRVTGVGAVLIPGQPVGSTRYFSSISFDTSGNASVRSAQVSTVVQGVALPDLDPGVFDELNADIAAAQADADAAQAAADAAQADVDAVPGQINTAMNSAVATSTDAAYARDDAVLAITYNPTFRVWTGTYPDGWANGGYPAPTKETTLVRSAPYAARWNCTTAGTSYGMLGQSGGGLTMNPLSLGLEFVTLTVDFYLVSGTLNGAGLMLDWVGLGTGSTNRVYLGLLNELGGLTPTTGKWYRVTKVMRRPQNLTGTQTGWNLYCFANYAGNTGVPGFVAGAVKDIVFDIIGARPSTVQEIQAYLAQDIALSRGTNLVTNGGGTLGNNTNFTGFTFTAADAPTGFAGSFVSPAGISNTKYADEYLPVDPGKKSRMSFYARNVGSAATGYMYAGVQPSDAYKLAIDPGHYMYVAGTTTTLAADLVNGATTITLTSSANWYGSAGKPAGASVHLRRIIFWNYVDPGGKAWGQETYSRNVSATNYWADGGITGNVITLSAPYSGPTIPAGTPVSNGSSGGTLMYMPTVTNIVIPANWTAYGDSIVGLVSGGNTASFSAGWPPGVGYARLIWLVNRTSAGANEPTSTHAVAGASFGDVAAAAFDANNIQSVQILDNAIIAPKIAAGAVIAGKIAADAVTANEIAANAVTASEIAANAVVTAKISADAVDATKIAAGAVTARQLLIADLANLATINEAIAGSANYDYVHTITAGWSTRDTTTSQYLMFRRNGGPIPFKQGERLRVTFQAYADVAVTPNVQLFAYDSHGGGAGAVSESLGTAAITATSAATAQSFDIQKTITTDLSAKQSFMIGLSGLAGRQIFVRNVRIYRMNAGELVVDGSIVAGKLSANAVVAGNIAAGAVTAGSIAAGAVTAGSIAAESITSVELASNAVIAAKIAAGAIQSGHIAADAITANMINSGTLASAITMTGYLLAGDPAASRVVIDGNGIRQYDSAGNLLTTLPTDPDLASVFEGAVVADTLTIKDYMSLQGLQNKIARGAVLSVEGSTGAPAAAPTVNVGYPTYNPNRWSYLFIPTGVHGNIDDTSDIIGCLTFFGYGTILGKAGKAWTGGEYVSADGGKYNKYGNIGSATAIYVAGTERIVLQSAYITANGQTPTSKITMLDPAVMSSDRSIEPTQKHQMNSMPDTYTQYVKLGRVIGTAASKFPDRIAFGCWGWNGSVAGAGYITLRQYQYTDTGATLVAGTEKIISTPLVTDEQMIGVTHGSSLQMGFPGTDQYIWLVHGSVNTYAYSAAMARLPQYDFPTPPGAMRMMAWGDLANNTFIGFRTTEWNDTGVVTKMTNNHWDTTTTSSKWWVSTTNYDADTTGGTHESVQGARAVLTMKKRAGLIITVPDFPVRPEPPTTDDPLSARIYLGRGNTDPTRAYMERVGEVTTPNRTLAVADFTFPAGAAAAPPPLTGNFPASSAGKVVSSDGTSWALVGDGKATFAGVEFDGALPGLKSADMRTVWSRFTNSGVLAVATASQTVGVSTGSYGARGTFVAPPSGVVTVAWGALTQCRAAGTWICNQVVVKTGATIGSGTGVFNFATNDGILVYATTLTYGWREQVLTGLTPGATYNFEHLVSSSDATAGANFYRGVCAITPSP